MTVVMNLLFSYLMRLTEDFVLLHLNVQDNIMEDLLQLTC